MKLNLDILCDHLPSYYQSKHYGQEDDTLALSRPLLFTSGMEMLPGTLYVARENDLSKKSIPHHAFVICVGKQIPSEWQTNGNCFLLISGEKDSLSVFHAVQNIFNKFDAWEHQIFEELIHTADFDLKRIIHLGTEILKNPLSVMDSEMRLIFSSQIEELNHNTPKIVVTDLPKNLSMDVSVQLKEVCRHERKNRHPYLSALTVNNSRVYCYNLYPFDTFAGCLCLTELFHPFQKSDYTLANYFFTLFHNAFFKYLREFDRKESFGITALRNLLNHKPLSADEYEYLTLQEDEQWICFKLKEKCGKRNMPKDYMCATLRSTMPQNVLPLIHSEDLLGLIRLPKDELKQLSILCQFQEILLQMEYTGGFSNLFSDINQLDICLLQAEFAAEQCSRSDVSCPLPFFYDHILSYMLHACTDKLPKEALFSKGLAALTAYDQRKGTEYLRTLEIFLRNERNITRTAEELFIHRSSLLKRLSKIKALTGEDLDDQNIRLYYQILFRLLKE